MKNFKLAALVVVSMVALGQPVLASTSVCTAEVIGAKFIVQGAPPLVSLPAFIGLLIMSPVVLALEDRADRKAGLFRCHVAVFGKASLGSKRLASSRPVSILSNGKHWYHPAGNLNVSVNWVTN